MVLWVVSLKTDLVLNVTAGEALTATLMAAEAHLSGVVHGGSLSRLTAAFQYKAGIINDGGLLFCIERIELQHSFIFTRLYTLRRLHNLDLHLKSDLAL